MLAAIACYMRQKIVSIYIHLDPFNTIYSDLSSTFVRHSSCIVALEKWYRPALRLWNSRVSPGFLVQPNWAEVDKMIFCRIGRWIKEILTVRVIMRGQTFLHNSWHEHFNCPIEFQHSHLPEFVQTCIYINQPEFKVFHIGYRWEIEIQLLGVHVHIEYSVPYRVNGLD